MKAKGITQGQLARRVGVSQPTIFKMIHDNKTGSVHLHAVARVLETSPEYLSGDTEDQSPNTSDLTCTAEDREWLSLIHDLNAKERNAVRQLMIALAGASLAADAPPTAQSVHSPQQQFRGQR